MEKNDLLNMAATGSLYGQPFEDGLQETHISWVLFTADFALKIKRPVSFSFLDFSTLERRRHFCEREVVLNSRTTDIYLQVVSITKQEGEWILGKDSRSVVEYGVVMKRQDSELRMDLLLSQGKVEIAVVRQLAAQVAAFHDNAVRIPIPFDVSRAKELFADLQSVTSVMEGYGHSEWLAVIAESIEFSNVFLDQHQAQFRLRADWGAVRDVHGDLHSRNIFLANPPIIFDCIEFKDSYRQIDVWYEVAFLCMDMEFFGQKTLSVVFFEEYMAIQKEALEKTDTRIFLYYKMLRANIRAKVLALQASPDGNGTSGAENIADSVRYLQLMRNYLEQLHRI